MKNKLTIRTAFILSSAILVACSQGKKDDIGMLSLKVIPVKTIKLSLVDSVASINTTGLITTENEAKCAFKIGGIIDHIYVQEGQRFRKGQLLASLKLTEIQSGVLQAQLNLEKVHRDYRRAFNLYKDSVATLEQLQNSKTALDVAQKQLDAIAFNKQYAFIYAEQDGFVARKIANEGEVIAGGSPVLAINVNDGSKGWVLKAGLSDKEWAAVEVGNRARVLIDAFPSQKFKATVFKKALAADPMSGLFEVELTLSLEKNLPAAGMFAEASIKTNKAIRQKWIPYSAMIEADGNKAYVFVPYHQTEVKKVPITIGSFDTQKVKVASGLENVSEIIVSNTAFLNEQSSITIQN
ncbi:efflux RND transporter periplasmic adaptor subunit [Ginsengibacter hankyongi]|uniref:Efflux RND transporter periplasmic adaptor subunit n=1 Tax=Ginsengibacter hankyongi TaxID=2607284 RepID=A0A5J5IHD3_9BACT|nr:efflux RND transporter periplasmic adaptor subunit [Ginsengibacter hankyongi]KAA9037152.1 efflux RND transporter periplasmic adaptor subunit [Ginsengibacter hankyongi]